jgi:hypothetical protein
MSRFYGRVRGERGDATRCGHHGITATAQSYDGSVITELSYENDKLMVRVNVSACSSCYGQQIFYGTYDEYVAKLKD